MSVHYELNQKISTMKNFCVEEKKIPNKYICDKKNLKKIYFMDQNWMRSGTIEIKKIFILSINFYSFTFFSVYEVTVCACDASVPVFFSLDKSNNQKSEQINK